MTEVIASKKDNSQFCIVKNSLTNKNAYKRNHPRVSSRQISCQITRFLNRIKIN